MPSSEKKRPPEKKISPVNSGITVAIWLNEVQTDNAVLPILCGQLVMWRRLTEAPSPSVRMRIKRHISSGQQAVDRECKPVREIW